MEISLDYPAKWDFARILRDLIQNFYDSIGWKTFGREFDIKTEKEDPSGNTVIMQTYGHPFSYEWLTFIGGSTKTTSPGKYIGMYGEGFKICALCLYNMGFPLRMESADWIIDVCEYTEYIAGKEIPMLGYLLYNREDDGWSRLTIGKVPDQYLELINESGMNFFYPENPLLGKKVVERDNYAIYRRSKEEVPCSDRGVIPGILFLNRLARGRLSLDLAIMLSYDMRHSHARNRKTLNYDESQMILNSKVSILDGFSSYQLLLYMEKYWNDMPKKEIDLDTQYYVICQLVRNISFTRKYIRKFIRKHHNLIYIERMGSDKLRNKRIQEASEWASSNPEYRSARIVNPIFRLLGARSVMKEYEMIQDNCNNCADVRQMRLLSLLFTAFEVISPYKIYDERPTAFLSSGIHIDPMQYCERDFSRKRMGRKYRIRKVVFDVKHMKKDSFDDAFLSLAETLLHVYGTDRSNRLNIAYTDFAGSLIDHASDYISHKKRWESYFDAERKGA